MKINPALVTALKALFYTTLGSAVKLVLEYGLTIGAAGLAGMAHPIPGVVQSGSAAFAVLASVRYFWRVEHGSAASADDPATRQAKAAQLAQSQQLIDHIGDQLKRWEEEEKDLTGVGKVAGPYL